MPDKCSMPWGTDDVLDEAALERHSAWPVVLVSMPFMDPYRPSIQLGLLKAVTARCGFPVRTYHAYLDFAAQIGVDYYDLLCEQSRDAYRGLAVLARSLRRRGARPRCAHARRACRPLVVPRDVARRGERKACSGRAAMMSRSYLDALVDGFSWEDVAVVGFTSTFQQSAASFALARRLKQCITQRLRPYLAVLTSMTRWARSWYARLTASTSPSSVKGKEHFPACSPSSPTAAAWTEFPVSPAARMGRSR